MSEASQAGEGIGTAPAAVRTVPLSRGLSTKLLLLTIVFVLLAEVLIFLPWIASYRLSWLKERLSTAAAVSIVLVQGESTSLSRTAQNDVLMAIGAKAIAVRDGGVSRLLVVADMPPQVDEHIDLASVGMIKGMTGALDTLFFGGDRMLRVFGPVGDSDKEFELIMPDYSLRKAMLIYSRNVAFVSLLISLFTAMLVYAAIDLIMIGPIRTMTRSMLSFSEAPDDPGRIIHPAARADEIGVAERELSQMQERLQKMLSEQKHLADLGLAVSKINHDMRNILASAQLMSDRLRQVRDPTVQAFAPKLLRALDRAVSYSEGVLHYGRTQEPPPSRRRACSTSRRASSSSTRSRRLSRWMPIPTSCSGCSPICAATRCRRWRRTPRARWCGGSRSRPSAWAASAASSSPIPVPACRRRRARTCSRRSAARRAAAAPVLALRSRMN
jgi:signal transduction histidine kinase